MNEFKETLWRFCVSFKTEMNTVSTYVAGYKVTICTDLDWETAILTLRENVRDHKISTERTPEQFCGEVRENRFRIWSSNVMDGELAVLRGAITTVGEKTTIPVRSHPGILRIFIQLVFAVLFLTLLTIALLGVENGIGLYLFLAAAIIISTFIIHDNAIRFEGAWDANIRQLKQILDADLADQ